MDNYCIQLCAEMAYNEVLFEQSLNEEYLIEGEKGQAIKEKVKNFFSKIINFIKNIFNKVIDAISKAIQKIKDKFSKDKKESTKQESALMYDRLMEMVLNESKDLGLVAVMIYKDNEELINDMKKSLDHIRLKIEERITSFRWDQNKDKVHSFDSVKDDIDISLNNKENFDIDKLINEIKEKCEKVYNDEHIDKTAIGPKDKKADEHLIRYFFRSLDLQKENLKHEIDFIQKQQKYTEKELEEIDDNSQISQYLNLLSYFYKAYIPKLSKLEQAYIVLISEVVKIANKSKVNDLKTEDNEGRTTYKI